MVKYLNKNFVINFLIILSIFFLDRFSKIYVIYQSEKNLSAQLFLSKYLNINLVWNEGIAFGLLSFKDEFYYKIITFLILLIIFIIILLALLLIFLMLYLFYFFEKRFFDKV